MAEAREAGSPNEPTTYNLLFVCTGNTCRSPMAAAIARRALERRGWTTVEVESAGVAAPYGSPASDQAARVARSRGLDLDAHATQPLTADLVDWADLILVMAPSHLVAVEDLGGAGKVALITEFVGGDGSGAPVDDPFGGDIEAYERTFDQLDRAVEGLLGRLEPILAP